MGGQVLHYYISVSLNPLIPPLHLLSFDKKMNGIKANYSFQEEREI